MLQISTAYWENPFTCCERLCTAHLLLMHINRGLGANTARVTSLAVNNFTSVILFFYNLCMMHLSVIMKADAIQCIGYIFYICCFEVFTSMLCSPPHLPTYQIAGCFHVEYFLPLHDHLSISPSQPISSAAHCCALFQTSVMSTFPPALR